MRRAQLSCGETLGREVPGAVSGLGKSKRHPLSLGLETRPALQGAARLRRQVLRELREGPEQRQAVQAASRQCASPGPSRLLHLRAPCPGRVPRGLEELLVHLQSPL